MKMRRLVAFLPLLALAFAACETTAPTSPPTNTRFAVYPDADIVQRGIDYSAIAPSEINGEMCQWIVDGDAMVTLWSRPDCEQFNGITMWIEYTAWLEPGVWRIGLNAINTGAGLGDDPTWYPYFQVANGLTSEVILIPASDTEVNHGYIEYTVSSQGYHTVRYWWLNDKFGEGLDANIKIVSAFFDPVLIQVDIDIKPGSDPNSINPRSNGVVPVAILGSDDFDVTDVDVTTLAFGPAGALPVHDLTDAYTYNDHLQDVNYDGHPDLVSHYRQRETGLMPGDSEVCISGATTSGIPIEGCDAVRVLE